MLAKVTLKIGIPDSVWDDCHLVEFFVSPLIRVQAYRTGEVEIELVETGEIEIEVVEEPTPC